MSALAGTVPLVRLALRRDRILVPLWVVTFAFMVTFSAQATMELYPTEASRVQAVAALNGAPALVAFYGRVYGTSLGSLSLIKMGGIGAALLAVLAFTLVIRHSRADEEAGRLELVGATVVGRQAPLTAAVTVGIGTSLAIGLLSALGLIAVGLAPEGAVAFGLAWTATGCAFTAVGAFSAQLTTGRRTAVGISAAVLGAAYLLRAVGDATGHDAAGWISWLSPIGWSQQVRPFAQERWGVLLLLAAFSVVLGAGAYALAGRRDLGAGLLADRPGAATAAPTLSTPLGLAWRQHRGTLLAWAIALVIVGAIVGSIATEVGGIIDSPQARDFITKLGGTRVLTDAYLALELGMFGSIVSIFGMQAAMRLRTEENAWRADLMLSTATGRTRWLMSHVAMAVLGTTAVLLLGGLASAVGYAAQLGDASAIGEVVLGAAIQVPAACVMVGIVVAVFGLAPRLTTATWAVLVAFMLLGEFGPLFELPQWLMDLSPFGHVPRIPGGELDAAALLGLAAVATLLVGIGTAGFRRRDVAIG
jgi:ABC-2 type transport system permease protein